jgi:hypothetical protein
MSEAGLARLRGLLGWLAAACCLCAGLCLADGFIDSFRTGPNTFSILPGGTESLTAPLPAQAADASAMRTTIDHPGLSLEVATQTQGFWLGNRMWQGRVRAADDVKPGTATVVLRAPDGDAATAQVFILQVFSDASSRDAASNSRIVRLTGQSPLAAAAVCFIAALVVGFFVFLTSRRLEALWTREGKAVVYMTKKTPEGLLISFGLGTDQGLSPGASVSVRDASGLPVATASVVRCASDDASALVMGEGKVELGSIVSLTAAAPVSPSPLG